MVASGLGCSELSGHGSPVVKALPAYSIGVIDSFLQQLAWVQNPVVVARQLLAGISNGMLLFLICAGLSLIFGVLRIINFAHGALFMLGALIAVSLTALAPGSGASFVAALIGATAGLAVLGALVEAGLLRRIYRAPHEFQLLLTFALVFVLGDAAKLIWGREDHSQPTA
jgi:branched-chain amino acid transport system permease protein